MTPTELFKAVLAADEFDDTVKYETNSKKPYYPRVFTKFMEGLPPCSRWLDVGCGRGEAFKVFSIDRAVEPNDTRAHAARLVSGRQGHVGTAVIAAEELHPHIIGYFDRVTYTRGFFQCRSDYETLIAVNSVLLHGGLFVFDVPLEVAPISGRGYCERALVDTLLPQFGFKLYKRGPLWEGLRSFAFQKVRAFGTHTYLRPQLMPTKTPNLYRLLNSSSWDYWVSAEDKLCFSEIKEYEGKPHVLLTAKTVPFALR